MLLNLDDNIARLADAAIDSFEPGTVIDERVQALRHFFSDSLIIAAFVLIDRNSVNKYVAPWGHTTYRVDGSSDQGSKERYSVTIDPPFCSCPAFAYGVLIASNHSLCKHVLAVRLAERLNKCRELQMTAEEYLVTIAPPDA